MIRWRHRKGDGSGLQSWHRVQTVPLRCSTVCRREHQEAVAARKTDCCRHNKDLIYVGSNPTGENRCLVDKAQSRHRSRVALKEEDSESAGIASEWRSGAAEGLPVPSEEKNRALSHGAAERKKPDSRTGAGLIRGTARRIFCGGFRVGIADSFERKGKK